MRWNRLAAAAGIAYVALAFVEFFGPGFPTTSDSARFLDAQFTAHRSWYLVAVAVQGVGNSLWIVFLCGLVLLVRRVGATAAALVALAGGMLNVAISLTGLAAIGAIAFWIAGSGDPMLTKAFFEFAPLTLVLSNFLLALMAAAVAVSAPVRWFRRASGATAVVFAAGGAALARHGAFSPDGAVQFATYGLELLWTLAAGIILLRAERAETISSATRLAGAR
ncbi:MAG TPA: hypothetical protein VFA19_07240 [Gaiellaceae bacterium]|nr:hypothetical protein [Gaiellaceae bacterium]